MDGRFSVESLSARLISQSVVYPTIRIASQPGKLLMGVYDEDGHYVDGTALDRRAGEQGAPMPRGLFPDVSDSQVPEAIYAGPLYFHFGHFLLESLARAWYTRQHPELPLVWAGQHDWQTVGLRPWQTEILEILQITNPTRIIADPARFQGLHVPDIGYRYDDWFHPEHAEFLGHFEGSAQVLGHRVWVSRSRLESDARDLNAESTERRLADAGWAVVHPEALTMREQLDHLSRADVVAGEEGSAFHAVLLLKHVASKKFHILRRHGREHGNLRTVGNARQINQTFYSLEHQVVLRAEGRHVSKITPNSSEILDKLDVPVPATPHAATTAEAVLERLLIALEPRHFLDVGASTPHLVVSSTAAVRVVVSPRFDFDPRSYATSDIAFYELGLNSYADLFHEGRGQFDVIRIAGSDFRDVMDAFRVSKRLAHEGTVWLLGRGSLPARVALAIRLTHPGFTVERVLVRGTAVFVVRRLPGEPTDEASVEALSEAEVQRRLRWILFVSLRRLQRRKSVFDVRL